MAVGNDPDFARDVNSNGQNRCSFPNRNQERVAKYNLRESYRLVTWVYACINVIAESISGVPLKFYDGPPEDTEKKEVPKKHPVNQLFSPPKPMEILTREDYVKNVFINLGNFGEIFSPLEMKAGIPENIDIVNPYQFEAMRRENNDLYAWKYTRIGRDGKQMAPITLADGQVLQFKYYDPFNRVRGLTPLAAGRLPLEQEVNMSVWNAGFFQGGIRNPVVILLKQLLGTGASRKNFLDQIQRDYTGFVKGHGPLVLEGGADAKPLMQSLKDLDFIEGKNLTREEICALFGVPPALVGIFRYANYANSREQIRLFWLNTLVPKMRLFRNVIQVSLLDKYWNDIYVDFDWSKVDALGVDPVQKATMHNLDTSAANNLYNMGYTKEEIALYMGEPRLVGDGKAKPPPPKPVAPKAPVAGPPAAAPAPTNPKKPAKPPGRPAKPKGIATRGVEEETVIWNLDSEFLTNYAAEYQRTILDPFAAEYLRFVKTFTKQVLAETNDAEINHLKWEAQWKASIESFIRRVMYEGVKTTFAEANTADTFTPLSTQKAQELVAQENPERSIEHFVNESARKSLVITGMLSGMLNSSSSNKLVEASDAVILPLMNIEEANWVVGRAFHHGKMLAQSNLGVTKHAWASSQCPNGHEHLNGVAVSHWADFPEGTGIHPLAKEASVPLKACTCTTHPTMVVVKLSTR
jgi:HK97 family phage portal protein